MSNMPRVQARRSGSLSPSAKRKRQRTVALLKKCRTSPSSQLCRKAIYYSKGIAVKGGTPTNRSMSRRTLTRNRDGRIVSKKKSSQSAKRYRQPGSKLRMWNDAIRLAVRGPAGDVPFPSAEPVDPSLYEDFDPAAYSPYKPPRRSERVKKPVSPGKYTYHGVAS